MIPPTATALTLDLELPQDGPAIAALLSQAFGPGRYVKVSERVRELAEFRPDLSFCAWSGNRLVGSVRMTRVKVGDREAAFLGPLAVAVSARHLGTGGLLVKAASDAAERAGFSHVVLVGDEPYFRRFGFEAAPASAVRLPGPVDQRRVLMRSFGTEPAAPLSGTLGAP